MFKSVSLRRIIQAVSLLTFLALLVAVSLPAANTAVNKLFSLFLMLDPLSALITSLSSRVIISWAVVAVVTTLITILFGRVFCGYICPMGTTVDLIDKAAGVKANNSYPKLNSLRFILLSAVITASVFGINLAFHFLPVSLATRIYGLAIYPAGGVIVSEAAALGQSLFGWFGYFNIDDRRYASILFIAGIIAVLFILSRFSKRFWCRYICPTGALLALISTFSPYKRHVENNCTNCGKCEEDCPAGAIRNIYEYSPQECITCKKCEEVCPVGAVSFKFKKNPPGRHHVVLTRRELIGGFTLGGAAALLSVNELKSLLYLKTEHGDIVYKGLIRPPGALPETAFLAKCIRCGQCMAACPTNGLQPLLMQSGSAAVFSPVLVPLRGKCESTCNICGVVCPTGAILELPLEEKQHAKIGTARVIKERCLAWEEDKACVVCDEVCPYNAMKLVPEQGYNVTVPRVDESRCFGCGACEHSCPMEIPAISVEPVKAIRLNASNYIERSKELGFELTVSGEQEIIENGNSGGLPPGFTE